MPDIIPTTPEEGEEYIGTISEDVIVAGVTSLNGETGDLTTKTINGQEILGEGNIEITSGVSSINGQTGDVVLTAGDVGAQATLTTTQMTAVNSGIDSTKVAAISSNTSAISDEAYAREQADIGLQNQIDGIAASSDVTDIVGTKAQLNAYDTSKLNDNDIIKVLQDESQDGETTYYRWSTSTQTFTLIGEEGPYYTKAQADNLLNAKVDKVTGYGLSENNFSDSDVTKLSGIATGAEVNTIESISVNGTAVTPDANKNVNISVSSGPTVVQTTGTSTTDVMSQNVTTGMIYQNSIKDRIRITADASTASSDKNTISIGYGTYASGDNSIAIGTSAGAGMTGGVAIGLGAISGTAWGTIALGAYSGSYSQVRGQMDIGTSQSNYGYNLTNYRLLTGVHDPVGNHDAATKGYVDGIVGNVETVLQTLNSGNGAS